MKLLLRTCTSVVECQKLPLCSEENRRLDDALGPIVTCTNGRLNGRLCGCEIMEYWFATIGAPAIEVAHVTIVCGEVTNRGALTLAAPFNLAAASLSGQCEDLLVDVNFVAN